MSTPKMPSVVKMCGLSHLELRIFRNTFPGVSTTLGRRESTLCGIYKAAIT